MKGRLTAELCFSVPTAYDDMRGFSKKHRDFLDPTRFVAFKKGQTFDPLSDDRQCVSLVSDALRPKGTRLSWENVHCYQPPDTDFLKYGNPNNDDEACDNLGYRRHPRHIYWLRSARDFGDLLGHLGEPGHTTREQLDQYFTAMRKTNSKRLTNHNRGVVNLFHLKELDDSKQTRPRAARASRSLSPSPKREQRRGAKSRSPRDSRSAH